MKIDISNLTQTEALGRKIGEFLSDFDGLAIFYLDGDLGTGKTCLLYTSPSPRDLDLSRMPSSA